MCYYWLKLVKLNKFGKVKKYSWRFKRLKRRRFVYKLVRHDLVYLKYVRKKTFFKRFRLYWLSKFLLFPFLATTKFGHYGLGWLKYKIFDNNFYFFNKSRIKFKVQNRAALCKSKNYYLKRLVKKKNLFLKKRQMLALHRSNILQFEEKKRELVLKIKKKLFSKGHFKVTGLKKKRYLINNKKNKSNLNKFLMLKKFNSLAKSKNKSKLGKIDDKRKFLRVKGRKNKNWNLIFNKQLNRLLPKVLICARKKKNNFSITATDLTGKLLLLVTIGMTGYKGPAKSTDLAVEKSVDFFCKKLKQKSIQVGFVFSGGGKMVVQGRRKIFKKNISNIFLFFASRFNKYLRIFIRRLKKNKIFWSGAIVHPVVSHNGMRVSKRRRK